MLFPQTDIINLYSYGVDGVFMKCLKSCTPDQGHEFILYCRFVLEVAPKQWSCKQLLTARFRLRNHKLSDVNTCHSFLCFWLEKLACLNYTGGQTAHIIAMCGTKL